MEADSESSKIEKLREWSKKNKVFFETFLALLLALAAIYISVLQYNISNKQAEVAEKQLDVTSKQTAMIDVQTQLFNKQLSMMERQEKFDYAVRLQLMNQHVTHNPQQLPEAVFTYKATLQNKGLKPVEISRIDFACGKLFDLRKSEIKTQIVRRFLKPDDSGLDLRFEISGKEILEIERKHGINQCAIYMVIKYKNALGTEIEREI